MPFDSSGVFNRLRSWVSDANAGIKIRADYHDNHDADVAAGLSECITRSGRTQPTANIPMNSKKIVNLGEPTQPTDAATKSYVDNIKSFATGMTITGANFPNGLIYFTATTGTTGLSFKNSGLCWVSKPTETGKWRGRIIASLGEDGTGAEMITIDQGGFLGNNSGYYTHNLSYDGTNWRTNAAGRGTVLNFSEGNLTMFSNDTVTVQPNQIATLDQHFQVRSDGVFHQNIHPTLGGNSTLSLSKRLTGGYGNYIYGYAGTGVRWRMDLGNGTAESGSRVGSDFYIYNADNTGANLVPSFALLRQGNYAQFWGDVYSTTGTFRGNSGVAILSAQSGPVILRPYGADNQTYQAYAHTDGYFHLNCHMTIDAHTTYGVMGGLGYYGKNGIYGGWVGNWHNWIYTGGYVYALVNNTNIGAIQMVCDYRTKRNVKPLESTWDKVKGLRPVKYQYKAIPNFGAGKGLDDEDDDEERWGFVAHELQEKLTHSAASFDKDVKNALQSPNLMVIVAALTKALQEAQKRIEALEAKQA